MRPIDADALIKFIENRYDITWEDDYEGGIKDACTDILEEINKMPTIEPQRKTGKWIVENNPGTGWYRVICSECGEDVTSTALCIGFYPNAKVTWDYCPNCGADMRGDQNED